MTSEANDELKPALYRISADEGRTRIRACNCAFVARMPGEMEFAFSLVADRSTHLPLSRGLFSAIDAVDFDFASRFKWHATSLRRNSTEYAVTNCDGTKILLHRFLLGAPLTEVVDHKDGNGFNNRRSNIRLATISENNRNSYRPYGSSKYQGVSWHVMSHKWRATICIDSRCRHLGTFVNEEDAAKVYDLAAVELFGEFARLNFPLVTI